MSKRKTKSKIQSNNEKKNYSFLFPIIIVIMACIQYANTLGHDYAWDDAIVIRDNVYTQDGLGSLKEIWTEPVYISQRKIYRPIPQTTLALEKHFFPAGNPTVGHLVNILLYAFCCFLLFHFFKLLLPQYHLIFAFLASLLFVVHPIHTEVVANIKSRDEILALSFGLASMIFFLKFIQTKKIGQVLLAILFLGMACLSKLNAITLLAVYPLLYFFIPRQNIDQKEGKYNLFSSSSILPPTLLTSQKILIGLLTLAVTALGIYSKNIYLIGFCLAILASVLIISLIQELFGNKDEKNSKKGITNHIYNFYDSLSNIHKLIIASLILGLMAFSIFDVYNAYLEILAFVIPVYIIALFFHRISAWDMTILSTLIILFSYGLGLHYTMDAALVLFFIYIIGNKAWNYKYFIPVAIAFVPYLITYPPFSIIVYGLLLFILYKNWDKRLLYIFLIVTIVTIAIGDYEEGIMYGLLTLAGLTNSYPKAKKIIPYFAVFILCFAFINENEIYNKSNFPEQILAVEDYTINSQAGRDSTLSEQLELSIINNSLINTRYEVQRPTIVGIQLEYLKKSFFPHPLIHNYGFDVIPYITWKHPKVAITIVIFSLLLLFIIFRFFKRDAIVFGLLFYFITLSIYTNIVMLAPDTMAERFLFFPSVGICLGVVFLLAGISRADLSLKATASKNNIIFYSVFGLILALGFFKTIDRNKDWKDNRTLATNTLPDAPNSALIHANYGGEWFHYYEVETKSSDQQAIQNAIAAVEKSIEIHPRYYNAMLDLGTMYLNVGDVEKARDIFYRSLKIQPNHITPNLNLGLIHYSLEEYTDAIRVLETARTENKKGIGTVEEEAFEQLYMFLARCYFNNGQLEQATNVLIEAGSSLPQNENFYLLLANMYAQNSDFGNAVLYLEKALERNPNNQETINKIEQWKSQI